MHNLTHLGCYRRSAKGSTGVRNFGGLSKLLLRGQQDIMTSTPGTLFEVWPQQAQLACPSCTNKGLVLAWSYLKLVMKELRGMSMFHGLLILKDMEQLLNRPSAHLRANIGRVP